MIARKTTRRDLEQALEIVNKMYDDNICWNRSPDALNQKGTAHRFTLRCHSSKGPGHRRHGMHAPWRSSRRSVSACWHVHGHFFEALFKVNPGAVVASYGRKITAEYGNWKDRNVGSMMHPVAYSQSCDCTEHRVKFGTVKTDGQLAHVRRMIRQADILKCPFVILVPEHYRADGSCKCDDPDHRQMMKREWDYSDKDFIDAGVKV